MTVWKPFDTAPKDGRTILFKWADNCQDPVTASWHDYTGLNDRRTFGFYLTTAHWEVTNPDPDFWTDIPE